MTAEATIVVDEPITRLEALVAISEVTDRVIDEEGTTRASVALSPTARARVDIPKFGEAPPLAIDVESSRDDADARTRALALAELLRGRGWQVVTAFSTPVDAP